MFSRKDITTHWWKYFVTLHTGTLYAVNGHLVGLEKREFLCSNARILLCFSGYYSALSRWTIIVSLCVIPFSSYDNFFFILFSLICFLKRFNCDIVATTRRWQMYTRFLSLNVTCEVPRSMMVYGSNRPWLYIFFTIINVPSWPITAMEHLVKFHFDSNVYASTWFSLWQYSPWQYR